MAEGKIERGKIHREMIKDNNNNVLTGLTILKATILFAFKMVFTNRLYIAIAATIFTIFWIGFNALDQLLFFSPILSFYLPDDAITGFILTNITSVLMGILVAMNVYVIRNSGLKLDKSLLSGSILGIASSTCASCSSIGFLIISTFGGFGIVATDLLTNHQTPLRIVSICILLWALYSVHNRITKSCILDILTNSQKRQQQPSSSSSRSLQQHQRRNNNNNSS